MPRKPIELPFGVDYLSILDENGKADKELEPEIAEDLLLRLYRMMVLGRAFDDRLLSLQRQGRIGTFGPITGQEASQLGAVSVLESSDWFVPSFRETAAELWRGRTMEGVILTYGGYNEGGKGQEGDFKNFPVSIPVATNKAFREGKVAAEAIKGKPSAFDPRAIPAVVYTDPQVAWCGLTEEQAGKDNRKIRVERYPWKFSSRATTMGVSQGVTKIVIDPDSGLILGLGVTGRNTEGLISEGVLAIEMGAVAEDVGFSIHPHPTLSETVGEAAELFTGGVTHLLPREKER